VEVWSVPLPNGITKLSRPERQQRGRIAQARIRGGDVEAARLVYRELKSARELHEAAGRLVEARVAQGKPARLEDLATLAKLARLIVGDAPERKEVPAVAAART
jgi:hypothetical protein